MNKAISEMTSSELACYALDLRNALNNQTDEYRKRGKRIDELEEELALQRVINKTLAKRINELETKG